MAKLLTDTTNNSVDQKPISYSLFLPPVLRKYNTINERDISLRGMNCTERLFND